MSTGQPSSTRDAGGVDPKPGRRCSRAEPPVVDEHHVRRYGEGRGKVDRVERAKALRGDPGSCAGDRAIGGYERNTAEHVRDVRRIDLVDEAGDAEAARHLRDGDNARDDVGISGDRRNQGAALPLSDDQLDQRRGIRIDDARNGLLAPPR